MKTKEITPDSIREKAQEILKKHLNDFAYATLGKVSKHEICKAMEEMADWMSGQGLTNEEFVGAVNIQHYFDTDKQKANYKKLLNSISDLEGEIRNVQANLNTIKEGISTQMEMPFPPPFYSPPAITEQNQTK